MVETPIDTALDAAAAQPPKPIVMDASTTATAKAVGGTVLGAVLIVATGVPTVVGLLKARDVVADIQWVQSIPGGSFIAAAGLLGTVGWRVWARLKQRARALIAGRSANDKDVVVKNDVPTILPSGTISVPSASTPA